MTVKRILKAITVPIKGKYYQWLHLKTVQYVYKQCCVNVLPGVYSPKSNYSTHLFLKSIENLDLNQKTVLDLGCGCGIISVFAESKGALVTSSDISDDLIKELANKSKVEGLNIIAVYSDLFENLNFDFDFIFINPPVQPLELGRGEVHGDCAGVDFKYFNRLFSQLKDRVAQRTKVYMVLPDEAELFSICRRAAKNQLQLKTHQVMHSGWNRAVVYTVQPV